MRIPRTVLVYNDEADAYATALRTEFPQLTVHATALREEALSLLCGCDTLIASGPRVNDALLDAGPGLRWVHALSSGTDTLAGSRALACDAIVTSTRGIHGPQVAELALLMMMTLARRFPEMLANQAAGLWQRWPQPILSGRHVVVVGVGAIGEALAGRCRAMGMRVTGIASARRQAPGFDAVLPRTDMHAVLADADFAVLLLGHNASTHHLFGAAALAAMPRHAFLLNLGRGGVVDENALLAALEQGDIAGAALDVFEAEPLAANHPFWRLPNVIVTPHIGGQSDVYAQQALPVLLGNMRAMLAGDLGALANRVR